LALLAVLAAALATAPSRLTAQGPAPAANSVPAAQTQNPAGSAAASSQPAPKSEQDELDVYRHAPVVQTMARMLHLDLETAARIFEFINFAIIFLAVGIPLFRFLPKFLRKRAEKVRTDIESARKVTADANSRLSAVEAKLSSIGEEIQKFKTEVERESANDEARIKQALEEESARMVTAAEQEIAAAAAHARRGLRNFAADLAVGQAASQLVLTPEADRALIAEFVGQVDKNGAARGGKN
jgi:F-type H+-transporting ATPase subunit b